MKTHGSLLLVLWALSSAGCGGEADAEGEAEHKPGPPTVHITHPQVRDITRIVGQPSFVEAYERTSVYPKMTGYIEKWNVDIGDRVKKADVLARIFVPELIEHYGTKNATVTLDQKRVKLAQKEVQVAGADVKAAQARLAEAQAILLRYQAQVVRWEVQVKRLKREVERSVVDPQILLESENQLNASVADRDAAKATILKAEAELLSKEAVLARAEVAVEVARADLAVAVSEAKRLQALVGYLDLPAPFDGIITARNANTFDFVLPSTGDPTAMPYSPNRSPGGTAAPIYVVDRTDIVRVFVDIPEYDAAFVHVGTKGHVLIQTFRDEPIPGSVTRTAWALNIKSRTLRAEIDLPNPDSKILPGMYAYGYVHITHPHVFALPHSALDFSGEKTFYWSYEKGQAVRTEVQTGVSDEEWVEVTKRRAADLGAKFTEASKHQKGVKQAEFEAEIHSWVPIDGSEKVIMGNLALLADREPVSLGDENAK